MDEDLIDHQKKCRFCLDKIKSTRLAVKISEDIKQSFFSLTNTKLKTSENYSSVICKTCLKDLESSVGFQQKIIVNQQRLEKFEFDDTVPVKEEAVEAEELRAVEIKTEFFEIEASSAVKSWLENPEDENDQNLEASCLEPEIPCSDGSDIDFGTNFHSDDGSEVSLGKSKTEETSEKPLKKRDESPTRVCPYCAQIFRKKTIGNHIEAHENRINKSPLLCKFCDFQCFYKAAMGQHLKSRHPEKIPKKAKKKGQLEFASQEERRKKILEVTKANPTWSRTKIAKKLGVSRTTVIRVADLYEMSGSVQRQGKSGTRPRAPETIELEKNIINSIHQDPSLSLRQRAKEIGVSHATIARVAEKIGFKPEVDDSHQIYKCKLCPRKYAHNQTLWTHVRDKHKRPNGIK